jgi:hypothetical protein
MGESVRGAARPAIRRASVDAARVEPVARRQHFADGCENARRSPTSTASRARNLA